jgi:hypothetical protein
MSPLSQDDFDLVESQTDLYHVGNRTRSTALLAWFIENVMREDPDAVEDAICDGGGDKGIDAILFDEDANDLFVIQGKHRHNLSATQGDADLRGFMGVATYFSGPERIDQLLESGPNEEVIKLVDRLHLRGRLEEFEPTVRLLFVTNAERDVSGSDYVATVATQEPTLDLWDGPRLVEVAKRTERPGLLSGTYTLDTDKIITADLTGDADMALALVPATELVRLPGIENLTIFDLNVRLGLGNTKINRELRATIRTPAEHAAFPAYHNGLTLLTDELAVTDEGLELDGVAVVNGCQSLLSLWNERDNITPNLNVVVKVVRLNRGADLADQITYRSNNQNPVNMRDQRANDRIQRDLQYQVRERYGDRLFYDIRRGQPGDGELDRLDNQLAAQMLMAVWLEEPWNAVRKVKLFDQDYHRIFRRATADRLYLAYLINKSCEGVQGKLRPELQTSFASVRHTMTYLIGKLVGQSERGVELLERPERWLPGKTDEVMKELDYFAQFAADETNFYVEDREEARQGDSDAPPFDPKITFKSSTGVRPLERQVVQAYRALDRRPGSDVAFDVPPN